MHRVIFFFLLTVVFSSCTTLYQGTVSFSPKETEKTTNLALRNFMRENPQPTVILKVPSDQALVSTKEEQFSLSPAYNAVEKELFNNGFTVRDRGLFNVILADTQTPSYDDIHLVTGTDLIIEISGMNMAVAYHTNTYKNRSGKNRTINGNITLHGRAIEFKVILVAGNQVSGIYRFNYAPCTQGCTFYIDPAGNLYRKSVNTRKSESIPPYELVETDELEIFFRECTRELVRELRSGGTERLF